MKKFLAFILTLLYMSSSTGAMIQIHYCMGKPVELGLGKSHSKSCAVCGMEKSDKEYNDCCHDDYKFFKSSTDQKISESAFWLFKIDADALNTSFFETFSIESSSLTEENSVSNAPPRSGSVPVFIFNCNFRI